MIQMTVKSLSYYGQEGVLVRRYYFAQWTQAKLRVLEYCFNRKEVECWEMILQIPFIFILI